MQDEIKRAQPLSITERRVGFEGLRKLCCNITPAHGPVDDNLNASLSILKAARLSSFRSIAGCDVA